jgi:hypothetical protein
MSEDELYAVEVAIGVVKRAQPEYRRVIGGLQSLVDNERARRTVSDATVAPPQSAVAATPTTTAYTEEANWIEAVMTLADDERLDGEASSDSKSECRAELRRLLNRRPNRMPNYPHTDAVVLDDAQAECGKSSGEAVAVVGPRIGELMANPIRWTDMQAMGRLPIGTKLYAAPQHSADIDAMRLDAERWRWLKMRSSIGEQRGILSVPWGQWDAYADAAIGAALQAKEPNRAERKLAAEARLVAALQAKGVAN